MNALATIRTLNGGTYEKAEEVYSQASKVSELEEQNSTYVQKIEELNDNISTLETEKGNFTTQLEEANNTITSLNEEIESLNTYKANIELKEKEEVISSYTELLSEEILDSYKEKISDFTAIDLDKELAYELKKNNVTVFSKNPNPGFIPKDEPKTGIEVILSKYKK